MTHSTTMDGATPWPRLAAAMLASLLAFGLSGCEIFDDDDDDEEMVDDGGDDGGGGDDPGTAFVRVVHAVADAPAVNALADGTPVVEGADFKDATGFLEVDAVATEISVEALTAGGPVTVITPTSITFEADTQYTVAAIGTVATIAPLVIENPVSDVGAGNARLQVVHAAPGAPPVDVYVTAPDTALADAGDPTVSFEFGEFTEDQLEVPAGDYRIRVTPVGDTDTVVYDSGTVTLIEGLDLAVFAVDSTLPGDSPISLLVADGAALVDPFELTDTATPTAVRVVHASPDAPAVDVIANDDFDNPLVADLAFLQFTDFLSLPIPEGETGLDVNVKVTPADNPGVVVNNNGLGDDLTLEQGLEYTVFATGTLADFALLPVVDENNRRIATDSLVRIVHGSTVAGTVDIYVTAPGAGLEGADPTFAGVAFRDQTGYVALPPGDYDVTVTPAGSTDAAIGPATISVVGGGLYTAVAVDSEGGVAPLGLLLFDDFANVE